MGEKRNLKCSIKMDLKILLCNIVGSYRDHCGSVSNRMSIALIRA
jgi:hypothetical protein